MLKFQSRVLHHLGRRESCSAALGINANPVKFDRGGQILWHYFATESAAHRHIDDEVKGLFIENPRPRLDIAGGCHTVNTIVHVPRYSLFVRETTQYQRYGIDHSTRQAPAMSR